MNIENQTNNPTDPIDPSRDDQRDGNQPEDGAKPSDPPADAQGTPDKAP